MTLLKLTFITLLSTSIYAQQSVQIDMHGGKDLKIPSHIPTKKIKSMQELLAPDINTTDNNKTSEMN
ncbi:MAG: hypothetical protein COA92_03470 [Sulfurovum sp.]|nr:MAG: hypothetical protein COA92_03470 [Sulfurovum sp.]